MGHFLYFIVFVGFSLLEWDLAASQTLGLENSQVVEGQNLTGNCTNPSSTSVIAVVVGGVENGRGILTDSPTTTLTTFILPNVTREDNGTNLSCFHQSAGMTITFGETVFTVVYPPSYIGTNNQSYEVFKGASFSLPTLNLDASPDVGSNFIWRKDGLPLRSGVTVTATTLSIASAEGSDNGVYTVTASNFLDSTTFTFTLTVICPPVFGAGSNTITRTVFAGNSSTINCTVVESCPPDPVITLTIGDVTRDITNNTIYTVSNITQSGSYICSANNTRAVTTLTYQIQLIQPPGPTPTPTPTPSPPIEPPVIFGFPLAAIIGIVVGVVVLVCVVSILVPVLICCCLGVCAGVCAAIGCACCAAKNRKDETELKSSSDL